MKKLILVCCLLFSISLVGCVENKYDEADIDITMIAGREFLVIDGESEVLGSYKVLIDKETKVQYLYDDGGYDGGFTAIIDADGKPILYEGDL